MLVVFFRGRIVDISLIVLMFSEMHVFSRGCCFSVLLETYRGEKRSDPRSSKQWESLCEINNSGVLYCSEVIRFLKKYGN